MLPGDAPSHADDFFVEEMENECLLYKRGMRKAIHLNETAAAIWKLSDGSRSILEIGQWLAEQFPENANEVAADVREAIELLVKEGALIVSARPSGGADQRPI